MHKSFLVGLFVLLCLTVFGKGTQESSILKQAGIPAKAFVWTNDGYVNNAKAGKVTYAGIPLYDFVQQLTSSMFGSENQSSQIIQTTIVNSKTPEVFVAVIGNEMRTDASAVSTRAGMQGLGSSWTMFQQVLRDASTEGSFAAHLVNAAKALASKPLVAGTCDGLDSSLVDPIDGGVDAIVQLLKEPASSAGEDVKLIMVCLPADSQESESEALEKLKVALKGKKFLGLYTSEAVAPTGTSASIGAGVSEDSRRSLAETGSHSANFLSDEASAEIEHDDLFFLQVDLLKSLLVVLFSVIALLCGLCCLISLDTPTKFESSKTESAY